MMNLQQSKERKVFINNINAWLSNFIIEEFRTEHITDPTVIKYSFMGTKNFNNPSPVPYLFEHELIKIDYNFHFENKIFSNDIIIYDLADQEYNEVEYVIRGLKHLRYDQEKVLILISNIMTWARTPVKQRKEDDVVEEETVTNDPEENKNILYFTEEDKVSRIPSKKYFHYKMLETLAFAASNTNPMLKAYVICPGILYGYGEDTLYDYFKMVWMQRPNEIPILGDGKNIIPTIHVRDLITLIRRIIDTKPSKYYIFAVDRTRNKTLKNIITSLSKNIGNGLVTYTDNYEDVPNFGEFLINLKIKTSKIFDDVKKDNESLDNFNKRKFHWHSEFGIPDNCEKLRQEFSLYRNLKSMKIFLTGPPHSGKTFLASRIAKLYNIPHIKVSDLVIIAKNMMSNENDPLGIEIKAKAEELIEREYQIKEQENLKKNKGKKGYVPIDRSTIQLRIPEDLLHKICKLKLNENICRNNGFVLDGYPRSYKDSKEIYLEKNPNEHFFTEEDKNNEEKYLINSNIFPNMIIILKDYTDDYLKSRLKLFSEEEKKDSHYNEESFNRRIALYKSINDSAGNPSVQEFFKKYKSTYLALDCKLSEGDLINKLKAFIEKDGPVNSMKSNDDSQKEIKSNSILNDGLDNKEKQKNIKEAVENENFEDKKNAEMMKNIRGKLDELKERERQILETKSQVLRQYLAENVIPYLAQGILEICQTLPEDPVQVLSDFLLEKSMQIKNQNLNNNNNHNK